ncbi:hypothetical protein HanRHA438_Chr03g0133711 [Helianthus annuus]|nr:hypothetical protein HanIR_Chr03g0133111 [Helianthus annuus]KAJ0936668.1 hypothetical protein HanRHA438_Chr03g0133711 [Helianthus annuus]
MSRISFHRGPLGMYAKIRGNIPKYSRLCIFVSRPPWHVCEVLVYSSRPFPGMCAKISHNIAANPWRVCEDQFNWYTSLAVSYHYSSSPEDHIIRFH